MLVSAHVNECVVALALLSLPSLLLLLPLLLSTVLFALVSSRGLSVAAAAAVGLLLPLLPCRLCANNLRGRKFEGRTVTATFVEPAAIPEDAL